jgi:putative peptide zinc metalloprotease protein
MGDAHDHRRSTADRTLPLRARGDLQFVEVAFAGDATYVVKDPVAGESFHLSAAEHALLAALRQPASLRALQRILESQFAPRRVSIPQLQQFVNRLYDQGLVVSDHPGQGTELLTRGRNLARRERRAGWLQILSVRLGGFDAGPFIDRLNAGFRWLCSRPAMVLAALLIGYAGLLAVSHAGELAARLPAASELARPRFWPMWLAAIVCVKVLHELGHAMACRHFGARPQEMGVLLLAGAPSLYCDVTDAWRLPSKWQRMAVSSAGMFVELIIAACAVLVWRFAEPGIVSTVALSLIVVCSVGTLLVNANPLLRYDGYYLLSDWLEVPNLAERGRGLLSGAWRSWLLGERREDDPLIGSHKRRALWAYAILSKIYMALVLAGLFVLFLKLARQHHLENAVYTVAVVTVIGMMVQPAAAAMKLAANPSVRSRFRWLRLTFAMLVLAAIGVGVALIPITRRVKAPLVVVPAQSHPVFAVAAGELEFAAPIGSEVKAGDVIARLHNPELQLALAAQEGTVRERRVRLNQLRTLQSVSPTAARTLPTAAAELADAEAQLTEHKSMVDALTVRTTAAGRILAAPEQVAQQRADGMLRPWSGSPLDERNRGAWIEPGTPLAIIATGEKQLAWAGVEQADVPAVEVGQPVRLVADQQPMEILTGRVREVARRARSNDGDAAQGSRRESDSLDDAWYHVVQIELDAANAPLLPGARGVAKIATYESTVGELVLNEVRRTFQRLF